MFGATNPSNSTTGADGNFYINTSSYTIFGPKTSGAWGNGVSITGTGIAGGGTAGQILVKVDSADFNTTWEDNSFANLSGAPTDNANLSTALSGKVDKVTGFGLSSNDYTGTEKTKLANLSEHFVGVFTSAAALAAAHPAGLDGQYATVESTGVDGVTYIWDSVNALWVEGGTGSVTSVNSQTGAVSLSTDNIGEGATNLYFTAARVLAAALTGISFLTGGAVVSTDSVVQAFGKLQAQITALFKIPAGGTTGQVLAKIDGTDGNTQWITPATGGGGSNISFNLIQSAI